MITEHGNQKEPQYVCVQHATLADHFQEVSEKIGGFGTS